MLSSAIVIFRETVEIALIVGIVLAATRGLPNRFPWIAGGLALGAAGAGLVAIFVESISNMAEGMGQEFFNAIILFAAALVIGWTVIWVNRHAREMAARFRQVSADVKEGRLPFYTLAIVIALAMLREGSETVLFVYGMMLSGQTAASIAGGAAIGVTLGLSMGIALYFGLLKLSTRYMFRVTTVLLVMLVAGLTAQGVGYLTAAGYFSSWSEPVWNTAWLLSQESLVGLTLHSLIGYMEEPTVAQLAFYAATLLVLVALLRMTAHKPAPAPSAA